MCGYLYRGKTFLPTQTQGQAATPLFLCVKTKTAVQTNCSPTFRQKNCCGASWKREGMLFHRRPAWIASAEDSASKVSLCKMMNVLDSSECNVEYIPHRHPSSVFTQPTLASAHKQLFSFCDICLSCRSRSDTHLCYFMFSSFLNPH